MDTYLNPDNVDEWEAADKFFVSPEHDGSGIADECSEGCDWCMSD